MSSFSSALKAAADKSLADGQLNLASHAAAVALANDPHASHSAEGLAAWHIGETLGSIDWAKLITQLQVLIPIIVNMLSLFAKQVVIPTPAPPVPAPVAPQDSAPLGASS